MEIKKEFVCFKCKKRHCDKRRGMVIQMFTITRKPQYGVKYFNNNSLGYKGTLMARGHLFT